MQAALFVCVLLTSAIQLAAQQETIHSKVSRALDGMHAHTWELREKALEEAPDLGDVSKESPDEADRLNLGLIRLLSTENAAEAEFVRNGTTFATEDHSEYYESLVVTVAALNDELAIPALLGSISRGGIVTEALARFGDKAVSPLLNLLNTPNEGPLPRSSALFTIQELLEMQSPISDASHAHIKRALAASLKDPEYLVRYSAIRAIEYLKDREDFVPALREVAERDPGENVGTEHHALRPLAEQMLQKIANHEPTSPAPAR